MLNFLVSSSGYRTSTPLADVTLKAAANVTVQKEHYGSQQQLAWKDISLVWGRKVTVGGVLFLLLLLLLSNQAFPHQLRRA